MSQATKPVSAANSLMDAFVSCYTPDTIQALANARLSASGAARVDELASKANDGTLTPEERQEYQTYIDYGDVLTLLHLKARLHLGLPLAQP